MSKYTSEFTSLNGVSYKVEITTEKGNNTEVFTLGGNPFVTSMDSDGKTIYAPIKTTGATIEMITPNLKYDIYSANAQGTKIKLTNQNTNKVEWIGYVTPCAYTQDWDEDREVMEIEAVDGIASLKEVPYRTSNKDINTFLQIIFKCLKKCKCYRYLYVNDNVALSAADTQCILEKLRISEANFFDKKDYEAEQDDDVAWTTYDVLFEIMQYLGYTLIADGEDVYIIDYDAIRAGRSKYYRYDISGSAIGNATTATITNAYHIDSNSYSENGTKVSLAEVFNQVIVVDDFSEIDSLLDGIDSTKNLTNITANYDTTLKNWFKNDSRFLESEIFTAKNKLGEDESFFISLTKADDGKIFFVLGKFYKHALVTTKHYDHNSNSLLNEASFNPMMYSKLWDGKGATYVGYFTKQIEGDVYNKWRVDITSNWDGQSKEVKLEQFGRLCNIANIGSKKLVNYILCLNQDTNHIEHDKVRDYPYFTVKKDMPTIFGGDGGYIVLKGTVIRHYMYNAPFPMNGTVYRHKDEKKTSIYSNEGYFWARLKWGNYYWKCEGDYKTQGDWTTTPSYFKIFYGDPTSEHRVDDWQDKDQKFYNNCGALWGVEEDGYYIPAPPDSNLYGNVEWTVYANKDTKGKWARNNKRDKKNSYNGFKPKVVLFKGLDITVGYADDAMNDDAASSDTVYTNDVSTLSSVKPMDEIKFKICTYDAKTPSYSTVDYLVGSTSNYLDRTYNQSTRLSLRQEQHFIIKNVSQYEEPRILFECNLKNSLNIKPWTLLTDKTLNGKHFIVDTIEIDYKMNQMALNLIEKANTYNYEAT